jgi:hypothetical protein
VPRAAALALAACLACASGRGEAEAAVRAYDEALAAAYRAGDVSLLAGAASAREQRKVAALVALKTAAGLVLESDLLRLEVTGAERAEGEMVVTARERWRYFDRPVAPGKPAGPTFLVDMTLRYHFVREAGGWKMDRGETIASEVLEPAPPAPPITSVNPGGVRSQR